MNFWVFKNWVEQITYDQQSNQGRSFGKLSPDRLALGMLRLIRKPVLCVCSYFCSPEKFQVSDILCTWWWTDWSTQQFIEKQSECGFWRHPATDSASCYRFIHLATDSGILLLIRASCYWFGHPATDSRILLLIQASCYRFRHLATDSGNLLQGHAICYRVMQLATGSCNWLQGRAICYRFMKSVL